ncbi:O-antigen/teichoic acid export membrane protein [Mobilisporobacter senegalensis]|uniref:O-antigen/teichoic acid export membrane protein n=1 Tax=Mobilisporobacter senegalensis TaxID=1329262 RepID=A0A3N1XXZ3_9FIRM|nr:lipopolysaccharide biosynthesis protein [Mobilisporobacter senegalensis]ROR31464.1 O-antigen/teichoic acid export membrane protein [Mobilisporobacter senegalensis]
MNNKEIVSSKKVFFWNIVGSLCSAGSSFYLLMVVTRICGASQAGIFSIAFAIAQLMLTIGRYGMRAYQATDLREEFSFSTYLTSRLITSFAMIISSVIYIIVSGYTIEKSIIIFFVCLIKMVDAVEDVFHGLFQQNFRMDVAGKLLAFRNFFTMLLFTVIILVFKNLLITCLLTSLLSIVFCILINIPFTTKFTDINFSWNYNNLKRLFIQCFALFAGSFLSLYIYNTPKNAIDKYMLNEFQTFYSILFMPSFVINLFSEFAFKPLLTNLAVYWDKVEMKKFIYMIVKLISLIIFISFFVILISYFIGVEVLSLIYSVDIREYRIEFVILLIGGTFSAGVNFLYNVLAAIRKQKSILTAYGAIAITATFASAFFVKTYGIRGASMAYLLSSSSLFTIFLGILIFNIIKKIKISFNSN